MSRLRVLLMALLSAIQYLIYIPYYTVTHTSSTVPMTSSLDPVFTMSNKFNISFDYYVKMTKPADGNSYARIYVGNIYAFNYTSLVLRSAAIIGEYEWSGTVNADITAAKAGPGIQLRTQIDAATAEFIIMNLKIRQVV